jgi:hypothetical protein
MSYVLEFSRWIIKAGSRMMTPLAQKIRVGRAVPVLMITMIIRWINSKEEGKEFF